jgi:sugar diacid utilization regulator
MLVDVSTDAPTSAAPAAVVTTLADLLALPALAGVGVVPRDAALDVAVRAVVPYDEAASMEPGALVIAPAGLPGAAPAGCAAVVARVAPHEILDVPVLVTGADVNWASVLATLVAAVSGVTAAVSATARAALRQPLLAGDGFGALTRTAGELLGCPVAIVDPYLDLLAGAGLDGEKEALLDRAFEQAREADPTGVLTPFLELGVGEAVVAPITGVSDPVGAVVAWVGHDPDPHTRVVLSEVVDACALEHAREEARIETESRLRGELIEELIAGEVVSRDSIVRRARLLGADLSNGAVAMIGTLRDPDSDQSADERVTRRFLSQVRAVLDLHWPRALVDWNTGRLLVLLPTPLDVEDDGPGVDERAHGLARRLSSATRDTAAGLAVTLALSRHTPDPERLGAALDEAELALSIGERLGRVGEVVTFEETGTYKLLFQIFADRPEELSSFYESTLAALVAYDEQYQTELVGTLATYLELDGNLAATAGTLYTHRHTVRYRLDRIAELSGLDVGKSDDREKLSLGLKAMRLLGRAVRTGPGERPARGRS